MFRLYMEIISVKDMLDFDVCLSNFFCGASRTDELHTCCTEALCKFDQPSFVVDGQQSF